MINKKETIRKRVMFYVISVFVLTAIITNFLSLKLMPLIINYGMHQSQNVSTRMVNYVVSRQLSKELEEKMIVSSYDDNFIEYNTSIINSVASNTIMSLQKYFYLLEMGMLEDEIISVLEVNNDNLNKGIIYEVPISYVLNIPLISNIGIDVPIRYKFIGDLNGKIISNVEEYGINNFLFEIILEITCKTRVSVPLLTEEKNNVIQVPLVIRNVQGEIPEFYLGRNVIGEVN